MSISIDEAVYEKLTASQADGTVYDKVGGRISAEYGGHAADLPYLVFDNTATETVPMGFHGTTQLMTRADYDIRVYSHWEEGVEVVGDIAELIVGLFNQYKDTTATNFEQIVFDVIGGTTIIRADETLVATVRVRATGVQSSF